MVKTVDLNKDMKPLKSVLSFHKLIDQLDSMSENGSSVEQKLAESVLSELDFKEDLYAGFDPHTDLAKYQDDMRVLLDLLFPAPLMDNEIKIAIAPMSSLILHRTARYGRIFRDATHLEMPELATTSADQFYINLCVFILQTQYGKDLKTKIPPVYNVTDDRGVVKYYKSGYNADFITISPLGKKPVISKQKFQELEDNYSDIDLWKKVFPPGTWEVKGFAIVNFTDVSNEEALSLIKNNLIGDRAKSDKAQFDIEMSSFLSTLLDIPDVKTSFTLFDKNKNQFVRPLHTDNGFATDGMEPCSKEGMFCSYGQHLIFEERTSFIMTNLDEVHDKAFETPMYCRMRDNGVKSFIVTPIHNGDELLGVMEFTSAEGGAFRKKHIVKVEQILGLCTAAIKKFTDELENEKSLIIQNEFTSIHPSVEWKFTEEAEKYIEAKERGEEYNFDNILFHHLTALYGQMDIAGSSNARNEAIAADLKTQMAHVRDIISRMCEKVDMPLLESIQYQIAIICEKLSSDLAAGMEQEVVEFLRSTINPLFNQMKGRDKELEGMVKNYFDHVEEEMDIIYDKRKNYDDSVKMINMHLAGRLDQAQKDAQRIFPHYFERYKTDGVEHNIFIGQEIAPNIPYHKLYLDNLRLWQLKTLCQLEIEHHNRLSSLPLPLQVASLIMVYSNPLAIKYRMDEKQFDVDGAYNARYEILKKRIDKAHIRGTSERITQPGKIIIIYTQPSELEEYTSYINYLTYEGYLKGDPEIFDIEQLQGVVGLKGLRVAVNFERDNLSSESSKKKEGTTRSEKRKLESGEKVG